MFNRLGKYTTESKLRRWAENQIKKGMPRQKVCAEVMKKFDHSPPDPKDMGKMQKITEHNQACLSVEKAIMQEMIDRNTKAQKLEKSGKTEQAIELFELSVRDQFNGTFPYDRLMVIYRKLKRYEDAVRVCEAYIKNPYLRKGNKQGLAKYKEKLKKLKQQAKKARE